MVEPSPTADAKSQQPPATAPGDGPNVGLSAALGVMFLLNLAYIVRAMPPEPGTGDFLRVLPIGLSAVLALFALVRFAWLHDPATTTPDPTPAAQPDPAPRLDPLAAFEKVVLVPFPGSPAKVLGLAGKVFPDTKGTPMRAVFLPMSPDAGSGLTVVCPDADLEPCDMPVSEAERLIRSRGAEPPRTFTYPQPSSFRIEFSKL